MQTMIFMENLTKLKSGALKIRKMHNRRKVRNLWNESKNCYWCGVKTVLSPSGNFPIKDETATFDHLYSRVNPLRDKNNKHIGVLSCYKCNNDRGREEFLKAFPLETEQEKFKTFHGLPIKNTIKYNG